MRMSPALVSTCTTWHVWWFQNAFLDFCDEFGVLKIVIWGICFFNYLDKWRVCNVVHAFRDMCGHHGSTKCITLQWRHNEREGVSNHRRLNCLLKHLFRRRSKKTSKLRVTGLCEGNPPVTGGSPHKGPVRREMFPFDDVIIRVSWIASSLGYHYLLIVAAVHWI